MASRDPLPPIGAAVRVEGSLVPQLGFGEDVFAQGGLVGFDTRRLDHVLSQFFKGMYFNPVSQYPSNPATQQPSNPAT